MASARSLFPVLRIIEAACVTRGNAYAGAHALERFGETLPLLLESIKKTRSRSRADTTPVAKDHLGQRRSAQGARPLANCVPSSAPKFLPISRLDLVVVRENTEDLYSGIDTWSFPASRVKDHHRKSFDARVALRFDYAGVRAQQGPASIKANIMKLSDGLFSIAFATSRNITGDRADDRSSTTPASPVMRRSIRYQLMEKPLWRYPLGLCRIDRCFLGLVPGATSASMRGLRAVHGSAPASPDRASPTRRAVLSASCGSATSAERKPRTDRKRGAESFRGVKVRPRDIGCQAQTDEFPALIAAFENPN